LKDLKGDEKTLKERKKRHRSKKNHKKRKPAQRQNGSTNVFKRKGPSNRTYKGGGDRRGKLPEEPQFDRKKEKEPNIWKGISIKDEGRLPVRLRGTFL